MSTDAKCPECGAPLSRHAVEGLCPACLIRRAKTLVLGPAPASSTPPPEPATSRFQTPDRFGEYELLGQIAEGGMGVVFHARHVALNRHVALKMIRSAQLASPYEVMRFRAEAEAAARLDHRNIVPIFDIGEHDGRHFFTMKLVDGGHLGELQAGRPLPESQAASLLVAIARAVHYAHQHGILHRDLKPQNILIDSQGQPQLTDFGLAKFLERDVGLTQPGGVVGTLHYMAPEQATGKLQQVTTATDVYGLGAVLYEMLTGHAPFAGANLVEVLRHVVEKEPARPTISNPRLDRDLETICLRCLEKTPDKRYASAEALAQDLERWLSGEPIQARPASHFERAVKWVRRKPAIAGLIAAMLAVALAGFFGVLWQWRKAEARGRELRANLYVADVNLAQRALAENNLGRALILLRKHLPQPGAEDLRGMEWRYLWQQARGDEEMTFTYGPSAESVAVSSGSAVAIAGFENRISIWSAQTGEPLTNLLFDDSRVLWGHLTFSPDGRWLLAGTARALHVWDTATWQPRRPLERAGLPAIFLPDQKTVLVATNDRLGSWSLETWHVTPGAIAGWANQGPLLAFSDNNRWLLTQRDKKRVVAWDALRGTRVQELETVFRRSTAYAISAQGTFAAEADWDGSIVLWDVRARRQLGIWRAHARSIPALAFSPDETRLASASFDQAVRLWNTRTGQRLASFKGHLGEVWSVAFSSDGQRVISASKDGTAKLWSAEPRAERAILHQASAPLFFSPDSRHLVALKTNLVPGVWDLRTQQELLTNLSRPAFLSQAIAVAPSADGARWAAALPDGEVQVWSNRPLVTIQHIKAHESRTAWLALSPAGDWLASASLQSVRVWRVDSGARAAEFSSASGPLAFSPDGGRLAFTTAGFGVSVWNVQRRRQTRLSRAHTWKISALAFSPDSQRLLTASSDATAKLWDLESGRLVGTLAGHREEILCGAFSPDGKTLATGSSDDTVKLWHVGTLHELATLSGYEDDVGSLLFSPDGNALVVGGGPSVRSPKAVEVWTAPPLSEIDAQESRQRSRPHASWKDFLSRRGLERR